MASSLLYMRSVENLTDEKDEPSVKTSQEMAGLNEIRLPGCRRIDLFKSGYFA